MKTLETEDLRFMFDNHRDFTLINVLSPRQFSEQHIPGSINVPLASDDFTSRVLDATESLSTPVVVYCSSIECDASSRAAEKLEAAGFQDIYVYEGGIQAWEDSGLALNALA